MSIHIDKVRIKGFRGLKNVEIDLTNTTVLTGMNNSGKTSFLKALQIAFGNRMFLNHDDFAISGNSSTDEIVVDVKIVPVNESFELQKNFHEEWEILFTDERIRSDNSGHAYVPVRSIVKYDVVKNNYRTKQSILNEWPEFESSGIYWYQNDNGTERVFSFEEIPFFYITASRDVIEDIRLKSSYLGRLISRIEYSPEEIEDIEKKIKQLNEAAVTSSSILSDIKSTLSKIDTTLDSNGDGVDITPFTKKIRDLNKGLSIYYSDQNDSFAMEHHGLGTRSWSSLLTLKSFINILTNNSKRDEKLFFPIIAIEEPEAHLHPNAQKKLFNQMDEMNGQKIISTHSTFIAGTAELYQICNLYKDTSGVKFGRIKRSDFSNEDLRKIRRQVINTKGHIFFSKFLIFCEGETEEQALPIFLEKYFGSNAVELGIDVIGVSGAGGYLPFMRTAESLNIPWFILSDAEEETVSSVTSHFSQSNCTRPITDVIVFYDTDQNFETELVANDYIEEMRAALLDFELNKCVHEPHKQAKITEVASKSTDEILQSFTSLKTRLAPLVAEKIVQSVKGLPIKVIELFKLIENQHTKNEEE